MAGRIAYFLVAGAAIVGGMIAQGDISLDGDVAGASVALAFFGEDDGKVDRRIDRTVDRRVDGRVDHRVDRTIHRETVASERATKRALSEAVAELVRAEGSLITLKLDEQIPASVIRQAEQRRDIARDAVERLADDAKAGSRGERDAIRENIRENIRDEIRDAVRG